MFLTILWEIFEVLDTAIGENTSAFFHLPFRTREHWENRDPKFKASFTELLKLKLFFWKEHAELSTYVV
jgi:hypothetical protein